MLLKGNRVELVDSKKLYPSSQPGMPTLERAISEFRKFLTVSSLGEGPITLKLTNNNNQVLHLVSFIINQIDKCKKSLLKHS